jgi:sulfur carrier protein
VKVVVNGDELELDADVTVAELVARELDTPKGVAVAVNAEVVPRSTWPTHALHEGDRVEVLTAAQGG